MNIQVQSWQDLQVAMPIDPRSIVLNAFIGANTSNFTRSTTLFQASWGVTPLIFSGGNTKIVSLDTTDASTQADALQWNTTHQMVNVGSGNPPIMTKVVFLRAGKIWDNQIEINFGATGNVNIQLTFRDNLATSGQFLSGATGSIPVFSLGNTSGLQILHVTVLQPGIYSMVLGTSISGVWSTFEMEWIVLP